MLCVCYSSVFLPRPVTKKNHSFILETKMPPVASFVPPFNLDFLHFLASRHALASCFPLVSASVPAEPTAIASCSVIAVTLQSES